MINDQKYSCTNELGAEFLVIITSMFVTIITLHGSLRGLRQVMPRLKKHQPFCIIIDVDKVLDEQTSNLFLSLAYALLLPLMSYLFSQAKRYYSEGRAQFILLWMVFIEIIRIRVDPIFAWSLRKSAEQLVRLFWVSFLICSFTSLNEIKVILLILCATYASYVVLKGIMFNLANSSYLIENNPSLIHNYMKRTLLKDDLHTTPLNNCGYIVLGEENHEISVLDNGYHLSKKKTASLNGVLTIGRVFQLDLPKDKEFTLEHPNWRDTCLSFALAKILRCRFARLSLDEVDCRKSLDFVVKELIDYIGRNQDIQTGSSKERNPIERVFYIIQEELDFVSDFFQMRMPIIKLCPLYSYYEIFASIVVYVGGMVFIVKVIWKNSATWLPFVAQDANMSCFSQTIRSYKLLQTLSEFDGTITTLLFAACFLIHFVGLIGSPIIRWAELESVQNFIRDPDKWCKSYSSTSKKKQFFRLLINGGDLIRVGRCLLPQLPQKKESQVHPTVLDMKREKIFFFLYLHWSAIMRLPKWVRRRIPIAGTAVKHSTNAKEATLMSLRKSEGRLTNGEISINNHGMEHLNWACRLESTTEVILVWHIATTLFQEQPQSDNSLKKQQVARELSSYCHYLVAYRPELLPNNVEYSKNKYEGVRREILDIDKFSNKKPTKDYHCNYTLLATWDKRTVIGKGANLAKDLMKCHEDGAQVWEMLADFWAEVLLFIAPSDNVEAHKKLLEREELITQLWALLTHAGILSRPKPTEDHREESGDENSETTVDEIV